MECKAKLEFNLPEQQESFDDALKGTKYKLLVDDIWNTVFRPYFKHGYRDAEINKILENMGDDASKLMNYLADLWHETKSEYDD